MDIGGDLRAIIELARDFRAMTNTRGWKKLEEIAVARIDMEKMQWDQPVHGVDGSLVQNYQKGTVNGMLLLLSIVKSTIDEGENLIRSMNDGALPSDDGE